MGTISGFRGPYRFLSNFFPASIKMRNPVTDEILEYPTVEHAYQAAKTLDDNLRERIQAARTPGQAKKIGRALELRPDWSEIQLDLMYQLVRWKFARDPNLKEKLLSTGVSILKEENEWGDTFWGTCRGQGLNHLGKILMRVRSELLAAEALLGMRFGA